jgi:hypothetical protein
MQNKTFLQFLFMVRILFCHTWFRFRPGSPFHRTDTQTAHVTHISNIAQQYNHQEGSDRSSRLAAQQPSRSVRLSGGGAERAAGRSQTEMLPFLPPPCSHIPFAHHRYWTSSEPKQPVWHKARWKHTGGWFCCVRSSGTDTGESRSGFILFTDTQRLTKWQGMERNT